MTLRRPGNFAGVSPCRIAAGGRQETYRARPRIVIVIAGSMLVCAYPWPGRWAGSTNTTRSLGLRGSGIRLICTSADTEHGGIPSKRILTQVLSFVSQPRARQLASLKCPGVLRAIRRHCGVVLNVDVIANAAPRSSGPNFALRKKHATTSISRPIESFEDLPNQLDLSCSSSKTSRKTGLDLDPQYLSLAMLKRFSTSNQRLGSSSRPRLTNYSQEVNCGLVWLSSAFRKALLLTIKMILAVLDQSQWQSQQGLATA